MLSTLLAIITTIGITATMKVALADESNTDEIKFEVEAARLAFNAKMREAGAPGYWPAV